MLRRFDSHKCSDVKFWVIAAIKEEEHYPPDQMWEDEPAGEYAYEERLRRIKFLKKHGNANLNALFVARRLESYERKHRCLSGACPECGRLFQRWFVRRSERFIDQHINKNERELVVTTIVPCDAIIPPRQLSSFNIINLQRRLKYALEKAKIPDALGGIDFSFNEDREGKYQPVWSVHFHLITSRESKKAFGKNLRECFLKSDVVRCPVQIKPFENGAYGRSYALKMNFRRRIGYHEIKNKNGKIRKCRNTSSDKLRAAERLELYTYLDKTGLADRVIFRGGKPVVNSSRVKIQQC